MVFDLEDYRSVDVFNDNIARMCLIEISIDFNIFDIDSYFTTQF
jgi:hypothetical protein